MKAHEHKAYDDSIRNAIDRAKRSPGDCFTVWFDGEAIYVRASEAAGPKDGQKVCIAQRWNDRTVQLRFTGGHSEFVSI